MILLILAWVGIYLVALVDALRWWVGSISRRRWLIQDGRNGAMLIEITGQAQLGLFAVMQTGLNLVVGLLALSSQFGLQAPLRGPISIGLLMAGAVLTMLLRRLQLRLRGRLERIHGYALRDMESGGASERAP